MFNPVQQEFGRFMLALAHNFELGPRDVIAPARTLTPQ